MRIVADNIAGPVCIWR